MDPNVAIFLLGLLLLVLFAWYFFSEGERTKRILGTALTVILTAFCLWIVNPPTDVKDSDGKLLKPGKIHLGLDLQGGTSFLIRLIPSTDDKGQQNPITPNSVEQAIEAIRKRVDQFGVSEPIITPQGTDRILVQIPGLNQEQIKEARDQLRRVAKLEFRLVHAQSDRLVPLIESGQEILPIGYEIKPLTEERSKGKSTTEKLLIKKKADLEGQHVTRAGASFGPEGYEVSMSFDREGAQKFGELTRQVNAEHSRMAIVLDGVIQSAPGVKTEGGIWQGSAQISGGHMNEKDSRNLASALQNPLQNPVVIEEERSASSTLGTDAIRSGIYAGLGGLAAVVVFVILYYHFAGLVALIGLTINILVLFGAMAMFGFVLTLPGIAGVILTIGLAVDANVLIYERLREEIAAGKPLAVAVSSAYEKAFTVIFDANATTLITAGILFWQATGPIKGFAVTLVVGIIASVFSAMVVTRMLFSWALKFGVIKRLTMLHLISGEGINFMGRRKLWMGVSVAVILLSVAGFAFRWNTVFGIDFKGGDLLMLKSAKSVEVADVRKNLEPLKLGEVVIQKEKDPTSGSEYITFRSPVGTSEKIEAEIFKTMPEAGFTEDKKDTVGKIVGGELARSSMMALGLGMLGIFIYVTARFEMSFAIGALVALLHDVIITVGLFAIFGRELSLIMVGAILTIAGYSINDTIVVYDRIREGLHSGRKGSVQSIMNASINETLSRTLLTSGTTLLSVASLFVFGGPVLHDFAFAILIGIVVGTYSSIFIASPIVLWWSGKGGGDLRSEVKRAELPSPAAG